MDWRLELLMAMRVLVATTLGGFIGWERELHGREAGIRTYGAVALGACVFALISTHIPDRTNPHVVAAGVVTGVGFLGAGVILQNQGGVTGLTTAATLWSTAAVGLAVGYGMYILGGLSSLIVFGLLAAHHLAFWRRLKRFDDSEANATPVTQRCVSANDESAQPQRGG